MNIYLIYHLLKVQPDLQRSIPSMVDGLKPGQRKILFCSFKRNFVKEAKVAQFSGYVSEHSAYHHGEQSLASTIIGMAQDYVGSNNINLLQPNGQFGTHEEPTLRIWSLINLLGATIAQQVNKLTGLIDSFERKTITWCYNSEYSQFHE
nr:dna topoisomerase 2 [Quercus suber]